MGFVVSAALLAFAPAGEEGNAPWIARNPPAAHTLEVGGFAGLMVPAAKLQLFETREDRSNQGYLPYEPAAGEFGVRLGYFPLRVLGAEAEAMVGAALVEGGQSVSLWSVRGHMRASLPLGSISPFVVAGAGVLGVASQARKVGSDSDLTPYFGAGAMFYVTRSLAIRLDIRDVLAPGQGSDTAVTHNPEVLVGVSWTRRPAGAMKWRARQPVVVEGTPPTARGRSDGVCPNEAGDDANGCPNLDPDEDGVPAPHDKCPNEGGAQPDGCPSEDPDADGLLRSADECPLAPETYNGYEDTDGCPDEMPEDLAAFRGPLEGIRFKSNRAVLRPGSTQTLDKLVAILTKYPTARVEIVGHTDSTGSRERNRELSLERADVVRTYVIERGVAPTRIQTRGAGPDEPIDTNQTESGRARNRRIEFRLIE